MHGGFKCLSFLQIAISYWSPNPLWKKCLFAANQNAGNKTFFFCMEWCHSRKKIQPVCSFLHKTSLSYLVFLYALETHVNVHTLSKTSFSSAHIRHQLISSTLTRSVSIAVHPWNRTNLEHSIF